MSMAPVHAEVYQQDAQERDPVPDEADADDHAAMVGFAAHVSMDRCLLSPAKSSGDDARGSLRSDCCSGAVVFLRRRWLFCSSLHSQSHLHIWTPASTWVALELSSISRHRVACEATDLDAAGNPVELGPSDRPARRWPGSVPQPHVSRMDGYNKSRLTESQETCISTSTFE